MRKSRNGDKRDGWYEIEPSDAQRFLDEQPTNRPLRESKALRFAAVMTANKWRPNGEPIILDENETLLDGQGRCRACVISGRPFESYVVFGVPRKFFPSLDTGQVRGAGDNLALAGTKNYAIAAAVCGWAIRCDRGSPSVNTPIANEELLSYARKNVERLTAAIDFVFPIARSSPIPASILTYVYMEAADIDLERAQQFARGVATGEGLGPGSPMLVLRNRFIALRGEVHKVRQYEKLALVITAWNYFIEGKKAQVIRWITKGRGSKTAQPFPELSDGKESD